MKPNRILPVMIMTMTSFCSHLITCSDRSLNSTGEPTLNSSRTAQFLHFSLPTSAQTSPTASAASLRTRSEPEVELVLPPAAERPLNSPRNSQPLAFAQQPYEYGTQQSLTTPSTVSEPSASNLILTQVSESKPQPASPFENAAQESPAE